jgi:hypothetical protein
MLRLFLKPVLALLATLAIVVGIPAFIEQQRAEHCRHESFNTYDPACHGKR